MKIISLITLFLILTVKSFCQYHIIVECYSTPIGGDQYYHIKYTPDNWIRDNEIHQCYKVKKFATDAADDYRQYYDMDYNVLLSTDKESLIRVARALRTIQMANRYNDSVMNKYRTLHKYYMSIKPNFKPIYHKPLKKVCCTITKVY